MGSIVRAGLAVCLFANVVWGDTAPELKEFQGHWEVVELSEDGHVIPAEAIRDWLPSGGKFEIADSAILTHSPVDGKKTARLFSLNATVFPRGIEIVTREKTEATGIYEFSAGRLVICLIDPADGPRPTEFSAGAGSKRMLMVLQKTPAMQPASRPVVQATPPTQPKASQPQAAPQPAAAKPAVKVLTDDEVTRLLAGTWRYDDEAGALLVTLSGEGTWSSVRQAQQLRLFQKVFVSTPISSGRWSVRSGVLTFHCTASVEAQRVNQQLPFTVRSISAKDMIFVDYMGRLGKATKVQ
jgi:uncharacterized protein (TIGR03067 family)